MRGRPHMTQKYSGRVLEGGKSKNAWNVVCEEDM